MMSIPKRVLLAQALLGLHGALLGCAPETVGNGAGSSPSLEPGAAAIAGAAGAAAPNGAPAAGSAEEPAVVPMVRYASSVFSPVPTDGRAAWPKGAKTTPSTELGSIVGTVLDADSGEPVVIAGVNTVAECAGSGCGASSATGSPGEPLITSTPLSQGAFIFDAYAASPTKLTLLGDSAFVIGGGGYTPVHFAHGPYGSTKEGGKSVTRFPTIYLCLASSPDTDQDGICDAAEKRYGTDPTLKDTFQTQASDYNYWLSTHRDLILLDAAGEPVHDPDPEWQGELLFDISTEDKRTRLVGLQNAWLSHCRAAGFEAVEPDNLDSYTRANGALSADDAQRFMQLFVAEAHALGLAVAQKNAADWVSELGADGSTRAASVGCDFAIIEECQLTGECDAVISHYGPERVFEIEYVYATCGDASCLASYPSATASAIIAINPRMMAKVAVRS